MDTERWKKSRQNVKSTLEGIITEQVTIDADTCRWAGIVTDTESRKYLVVVDNDVFGTVEEQHIDIMLQFLLRSHDKKPE